MFTALSRKRVNTGGGIPGALDAAQDVSRKTTLHDLDRPTKTLSLLQFQPTTNSASHPLCAVFAVFLSPAGPTPHFPTENLGASRWRRSAKIVSSLSAFAPGDGNTDAPGTDRVVVVTPAEAKLDQQGQGEIGGDDEARTPLLRKRRVRYARSVN